MQIQLTEQQAAALRRMAGARDRSMAALIRELVDAAIADAERPTRYAVALASLGEFRSGLTDVATEHDRYLADGNATW